MDKFELQTELFYFFLGKNGRPGPSQGFARKLLSNPSLLDEVIDKTKHFNPSKINEALYILMVREPEICIHGKKPLFNSFDKGYRYGCANKSACICAKAKQAEIITEVQSNKTLEEKQKILALRKETCLEIYGVDNPMKDNGILQKQRDTCEKNNGVKSMLELDWVHKLGMQSISDNIEQVVADREKTCLEKYGVSNASKSDEVKSKIVKTTKDRYNVENYALIHLPEETINIMTDSKLYSNYIEGKTMFQAAEGLGVNVTTIYNRCMQYGCRDLLIAPLRSRYEEQYAKFLESNGLKFKQNVQGLIGGKQELDLYLPEYNLAIEIHGLYWHSELIGEKGKKYHYEKYNKCKQLGITLLQYFEDEIVDKSSIIESKILYMTNNHNSIVGARKLEISEVSLGDEKKFLNENHIQGEFNGRQAKLGAYHNGNLVGFISGTYNKRENNFELCRFASEISSVYPGLFSKLLQALIKKENLVVPIKTFSDNRHGNGNLYLKSGFDCDGLVPHSFFYTDHKRRYCPDGYMKNKLEKRFGIDTSGKTEWQLMQELGYDRIWDAGKIRWIYTKHLG